MKDNIYYDVKTLVTLSTIVSEKLEFYKKKIGIRKSALINGLLDTYLDSYCKELLKKLKNYEEE